MMYRELRINMKSNYSWHMRFSLIIVLLCSVFSAQGQENWQKLTVVANQIGTESLTKDQVSKIFKGNLSRWKNDESVTLVMPSSKHEGCEIMAMTVFRRDMKYVKKYWLNLVFQGRSNPPVYLDSNEEILNYVSKHSGSIGILVNSNNNSSLKITIL